jgi:hypothetical protein
MILLLHMRVHLIASSSISIIMILILAPVAVMMLHLRLRALPIQGVVVIAFNKFHNEILSNMLLIFISKYLYSSSKILV